MNGFDVIKVKRRLLLYAALHGLPVPRGFRWFTPLLGDAGRELLLRVQSDAGLSPTGQVDGPTVEVLLPDVPFARRVVRIARAELAAGDRRRYTWAGALPPAGDVRLAADRNWPYRGAGSAVGGLSTAGAPRWPAQSQWGPAAADHVARAGLSGVGCRSAGFCHFVLSKAGYAGPWPDDTCSVASWMEATRKPHEPWAEVPWNEAHGGDLVVFHWGGDGPPDHIGISLRYRRFFHDVATVRSAASPTDDEDGGGCPLLSIPLFTWQITHVIRVSP